MTSSDPESHQGHRHRLRTRFLKDLGKSMPDYELLELILTQAIPRRDMKPLARKLLKHYGSMGRILAAPVDSLQQIQGMGPSTIAALKIIHIATQYILSKEIKQTDVLSSWQNMVDYCRVRIGYEEVETLHAIFLNKRNQVIADKIIASGTIDKVSIHPREIIKIALNINATALILIHNHPSGNATPSKADIISTQSLYETLSKIDIKLFDHLIISPEDFISFNSEGLLC